MKTSILQSLKMSLKICLMKLLLTSCGIQRPMIFAHLQLQNISPTQVIKSNCARTRFSLNRSLVWHSQKSNQTLMLIALLRPQNTSEWFYLDAASKRTISVPITCQMTVSTSVEELWYIAKVSSHNIRFNDSSTKSDKSCLQILPFLGLPCQLSSIRVLLKQAQSCSSSQMTKYIQLFKFDPSFYWSFSFIDSIFDGL